MRWTYGTLQTWTAAIAVVAAVWATAPATARADDSATKAKPVEEPKVETSTTTTPRPTLNRRSVGGKGADRFINVALGQPIKSAYLGITASPAEPVLQKQLQLKAGVGLVVDGVELGSPAAQAGVREYDVLHKFDDQLLINNEQFDVLIRMGEPTREVKLTVFREGKPLELAAKLVERELVATRVAIPDGGTLLLSGDPRLARTQNDFATFFAPVTPVTPAPSLPQVSLRAPDGTEVRAARITIESDKHKMTVTNPDGRKHLKVEDKAGAVLFDGPISTAAEMEKVPAELRQAYEQIFAAAVPDAAKPTSKPTPPTPSPSLEPAPSQKK